MFPIYFIVGLINIFAQRNNYGIKDNPSGMDIRVRRSLPDTGLEPVIHTDTIENQLLDRPKRYAYYRKIKIPANENQNYGHNTTNRYDIFNPNFNYLFNRTSVNRTGSNSGPGYANYRPVIRSYPYGYPPGYEPRTVTPGYRNPVNTPDYYNYQNPNGRSFDGYYSHTPRPVNYSPLTDMLASYPKNNINNFRGSSGYNNNPYGVPPNNNNSPTPTNTYYNLPTAVSPTPMPNNNPYGVPPNNNNTPTPNNNYYYNNLPTAVSPTPTPNNNPYGVPPNNNNSPTPTPNNNNYYLPTAVSPTPTNNNNPYGVPPNNNNSPTPTNNNYYNQPTTISPTPNNSPYGSQSNNSLTPTSTLTTPTNVNVTSPSSNITTTTEKIVISCIICNIRCPAMMKWFGGFCIPDDYE